MKRLLLFFAAAWVGNVALAQSWPAKPVRIVAPFAPGGSADTLGRIVAQKLTESLKENFVVENRPGAGGVIGSEAVAKAPPDGYTLLVSGVASHAVAPALPRGTPYDPVKDFTHIALFGGPPAVLVVNPNVPAQNLKEFVGLLKKEPGKYSYGSPGNGTHGQLVAELFKHLAGVDMQHVPYKGASNAMADLIAGHIQVALHHALDRLEPDPRRQGESPRDQHRDPAARVSERADVRRDGLQGPGRHDLVLALRAGRHARRHRRAPERRGAQGARCARHARAAAARGHRAGPAHGRGVHLLRSVRGQALGADRQGLRRQERLSAHVQQEFPRFSEAEYSRRHRALATVMQQREVDHLLIVTDQRTGNAPQWVTGWPGTVEAYRRVQARASR